MFLIPFWTVAIFVFILGLVAGSFINVVIYRLHEGRQFIKGRSACPHCKRQLSAMEMIPVLSWVLLRGKCKHCGERISWQYPAVELLTAILFVLAYLTHPFGTLGTLLVLLLWFYVIGSFIVLAVYDLRWYTLPDKVLLPIMIPAAIILVATASATGNIMVAVKPLIAGLVFGGFFYLIALISKGKWMGGGDIKLAFIMGLLLGLQKTALAMLLAFWSAALVGLVLIGLGRKKRTDLIPFGPFLIAGTITSYLAGGQIIEWYLNISGLNLL